MRNFDNIQVGDKVIICNRYEKSVGVVEKITAKFFYANGVKYRKIDGSQPGDIWSASYCDVYDEEVAKEISRLKLNRIIRNHIMNVSLDLSYDDALKVKTILGI
jgi:hypothetical protein